MYTIKNTSGGCGAGIAPSGDPGSILYLASSCGAGAASNVLYTGSGSLFVGNSVTTTNLFATTANVGTLNVWQISNLSSLFLSNNLYASNAVTTTNLFATGNVTVGDIMTIGGLAGFTSLNVTGNLYVSNAVTTTNVFATNVTVGDIMTIGGLTGFTSLNVTGNIYASNSVTTTNVVATSNVGIGTASPSNKLSVNSTTAVLPSQVQISHPVGDWGIVLKRTANDNGMTNMAFLKTRNEAGTTTLTQGDNIGRMTWHAVTNGTGPVVQQLAEIGVVNTSFTGGNADGSILFWTKQTTDANPLERMRIRYDGNLGIGTASPSVKLDIVGALKTSTNSTNYVVGTGTAVTVNTVTPTTVASVTITTVGKPVFIICCGDLQPVSATPTNDWCNMRLYQGAATVIGNATLYHPGTAASTNHMFSIHAIDVPAAGTYTYTCKAWQGSGSIQFGEVGVPYIVAWEFI